MKVLVFEDNLMWSSRLMQSIRGLGHTGELRREIPTDRDGADAAIVNLGQPSPEPMALVAALKALGIRVIAHAGHKEKELMALGTASGADVLATNSELTFKIDVLLVPPSV